MVFYPTGLGPDDRGLSRAAILKARRIPALAGWSISTSTVAPPRPGCTTGGRCAPDDLVKAGKVRLRQLRGPAWHVVSL
jgi:hypothetical protein